MNTAVVSVCVDPRIDHRRVRSQVERRLARMKLDADRVFIVNGLAGNVGPNVGDTARLLSANGDQVVFAAVVHHDDCIAAGKGWRKTERESLAAMGQSLKDAGFPCPVEMAFLRTEDSHISWPSEPRRQSQEVSNFRMPRL
jgi:hypothetical protein